MPELDLNKLTTIEQLETTSNAILDKVKNKGYALDSALAAVAKSGDADDVAYDNTTSGLTATDAQTAIDELAKASAGGVASKTVYMADASSSQTAYAKVYKIYQGSEGSAALPDESELIGTINVPKDMVVEEGTVVDITYDETEGKLYDGATDVTTIIKGSGTASAADAGKYIKLVIANATNDKLYIKATDLVDIYTAGNGLTLSNGEFSVVVNSSAANGLSVGSNGLELAVATTTTAGAMSAADKAKLDAADVTAYTAGNGIDVTNHEISATVVAANGLSVGANGIAMAVVTAATSGVGGANGAMTAADKEKLDNADVTAYTAGNGIDITSHAVTAVVDSTNANGLSVGTDGIALAAATQSAAGAMSAADKTKLDGADVTAYTGSGAISVTNHEITVAAATPSTSGVGGTAGTMSAADKEKLDSYGVATDAEITTMIAGLHDL